MDSERAKEEKAKQERLNDFRDLIHVAYQLFDGKYTMDDISYKLPYKQLLDEMDREQEDIKKNSEARSNKKAMEELKGIL